MKNGWQTKQFEDCVDDVVYTTKIQRKNFLSEGKYPVVSQEEDLINGHWDKMSDLFKISRPVIIFGDHTKVFKYVDFDFVIGADGVKILQPKEFILPKFFYYQLQIANLDSLGYARHYKLLRELEIKYPSVPEQKRIVMILDDFFRNAAEAKEIAEKNLQNAREIFESYLQSVFANLGDGWEKKRFDEICVLQRGFDLPTQSRKKGNFPLVSSNGITDRIDIWKVKAPGVVTGRSGTIGNVHFIEEDHWPLNTSLYIKEFHGNDEKFVYYFLRQFDLSKYSSGAGVPTLNRNNVHSESVHFPKSLTEQRRIVTKLDALSVETKKLEVIYQQKLADLEELKKSILQKAFNDELAGA